MWRILPDDLNKEGHLLTIDSRNLKWPQLKTIVTKGKKFRLESDVDTVLVDLRRALDDYAIWYCRKFGDSSVKLASWANEVYVRCRENWQKSMLDSGHSGLGLKKQYVMLRTILSFLHDDRAPHGLLMVCKRWYQREMARYLMDSSIFESCPNLNWKDVVKDFNVSKGFSTGSGIVYNYAIWKLSSSLLLAHVHLLKKKV